MTEPTPDAAPDQQAAQLAEDAQPKDDQTADSTDWKAEARKWEDRAKANKKAAEDLDKQRKAAMTESERAVAEAEERGRMSAVTAYGQRLARTEFIAEAARRNPGFDASAILDDLNLARYIGEDGEPASKEIAKAVARLVPEAASGNPQPPSFDGGTRQPAQAGASMSQIIRAATGRA